MAGKDKKTDDMIEETLIELYDEEVYDKKDKDTKRKAKKRRRRKKSGAGKKVLLSLGVTTAREFDTLKFKKVLQSLDIGLFFCLIFRFTI